MSHNPTITDSLQFPTDSKVPRALFGIGAVGLIASMIGYFLDADQFFFSYLVSFVFFTGIALAALLMVMLHHITRSSWGVLVRRISETFSANLWIWSIFAIPILLGIHNLYHWSHEDAVAADSILQGKSPYLNTTFFVIRQFIYFGIWGFLGYKLHKASVDMDETGDWGITSLMRKISAPGIPLFALSVAFASFDWLMSLDPHWFSTMFGVYFFAMFFQAFWPIMILLVFFMQGKGILQNTIQKVHIYDLGAWFFAFTIFYAYIAFCQFLLIYYANLPEETLWYYHRMEGGWKYILYSLLLFRFAVPFLVLLNREAKHNRKILGTMSALVVFVHFAEVYWIAMPVLNAHDIHVSWMDVTTFLGLGGIFFGLFFNRFSKHKMVPVNDPKLDENLSKSYHQ
ncbi:MAG: hypothetical protein WEA79_12895 [Balneolaceae bacterium]